MRLKPIWTFYFLISTTLFLNHKVNAKLIDISVEAKHTTVTVSGITSKPPSHYEYRLVYHYGQRPKVETQWQSSPHIRFEAKLGDVYNIELQARDLSGGNTTQLLEESVSLASLLKVKTNSGTLSSLSSTSTDTDWNNIFSVNIDAFPLVDIVADLEYQTLDFSDSENNHPLINQSGIRIREDGRFESITRFIQPDPNSDAKIVDIVFVHDDSGSLGDEAAQVRANILSFAQTLADQNFDFRIGLVPYGGRSFSSPSGTILNNGALTNDIVEFQGLIDQMRFDGGNERAFDAMHLAANNILWRQSTQKVIVLVTDENNDSGSIGEAEVIQTLASNNVLFYGLTANHAEFNRIAAALNGRVFNVRSEFSTILSEIGLDITARYALQYESDNTQDVTTSRTVVFQVDTEDSQNQAISGEFELQYTPALPIDIELGAETNALLSNGQLPGVSLNIDALVTSNIPINSVTLAYNSANQISFTFSEMQLMADGSYRATIPALTIEPGIVGFYIIVNINADTATKTAPSSDPQGNPFEITIFPNIPPILTHRPVMSSESMQELSIEGSAEDASNEVSEVSLYYREYGAPVYKSQSIFYGSSFASFQFTIEPSEITENGLEYYIEAIDDFGSKTQMGTPDLPFFVSTSRTSIPAICNDYANMRICANDFSETANDDVVVASGNVQMGKLNGSLVLGFSGALQINTLTNRANSLGFGRLAALDIILLNSDPVDVPLDNMLFEVNGTLTEPTVTPNVFEFSRSGMFLTGSAITINDSAIEIASSANFLLPINLANLSSFSRNQIDLGQLKLSQLPNDSSQSITFGFDEDTFTTKLGESGFSASLEELTFDFLAPSAGFNGAITSGTKKVQLESTLGFIPLQMDSIGFSYEDESRKPFLNAKAIYLGATGWKLVPQEASIQWSRVDSAIEGSVTGYLSDATGGFYTAGRLIDRDIVSGALTLRIENGLQTWSLGGQLFLLEAFELASLKMTSGLLPSTQIGLTIEGKLNIFDMVTGDIVLNGQTGEEFTQFLATGNVGIQAPTFLRIIGDINFNQQEAEFLLKISHQNNNALTAYVFVRVSIGGNTLGVLLDFSDPLNLDWDILGREERPNPRANSAGNSSEVPYTFRVLADDNIAIFTIQTDAGLAASTLTLPDNTQLDVDSLLINTSEIATTTLETFAYTNEVNQVVVVLSNPAEGNYLIDITNELDLTNIDVNMLIPATEPSLAVTILGNEVDVADTLTVSVELDSGSGVSELEILLQTLDGKADFTLTTEVLNSGSHTLNMTLPARINPGEFTLVALVRSGGMVNRVVANDTVKVTNSQGPVLPSDFNVTYGNTAALVSWLSSTDTNVANYIIKVSNQNKNTQQIYVVDSSITSLDITNLINWDNYLIQIASQYENSSSSGFGPGVSGSPTGSFVGGTPDLSVPAETILLTSETGDRGEPFVATAKVKNTGNFAAYSSRLNCYYSAISEQNLVSSTLLPTLSVGEELDVRCEIDQNSLTGIGKFVFFTITDVVLPEANRANNSSVVANPYAPNFATETSNDLSTTLEDTSVTVDVLANDFDVNDDVFTIDSVSVSVPANGSAMIINGNIVYTPAANFNGQDSFTYTVSDGRSLSNSALVTIDVTPVNDSPEVTFIGPMTLSENSTGTFMVEATDADGDDLTYTIVQLNGASLELADTTMSTFKATSPYVSDEEMLELSITVNDGTIDTVINETLTILNDNQIPTLSLSAPASVNEGGNATISATAIDADNDDLAITWLQTVGPTATFIIADTGITVSTPEVSSNSIVTFEATLSDGEHNIVQVVSISVINVANVPEVPAGSGDSGGGSMNWYVTGLAIMIYLRRRKKQKPHD